MIRDYVALIGEILGKLDAANVATAAELARLPLKVRGFGHVKLANAASVAEERAALLAQFRLGGTPVPQAAE